MIDGSPPAAQVLDSDDTIIVQRPSARRAPIPPAPEQDPLLAEPSPVAAPPEPEPAPSASSPHETNQGAPQPAIFELVEPPLGFGVLAHASKAAPASDVTDGPPAPRVVNTGTSTAAHYRFRIADTVVGLDKTAFIGRKPGRPRVIRDESLRLVHVPSAHQEVSKTHLEVRQRGASVIVTDLGSTNGSVVNIPGSTPRTLRPGESMVVTPGTLVDIGDGNLVEILPIQRS
jgi:hypothetical protein